MFSSIVFDWLRLYVSYCRVKFWCASIDATWIYFCPALYT